VSPAVCPALQYFSHYLKNGTVFEKIIEHKVYVLIISISFSEQFLILRRTEQDMIKNVYWSSCKVPLFFCDYNGSLTSLKGFRKNSDSNFMDICPVAAELFHAKKQTDGQAGMTS
jgi:hypothetical protein